MVDKKTTDADEIIADTDEPMPEEADLSDVEDRQTDKIKALQAKLKTCEAEKASHLEDLQRAKAEFLNAKKRLEEEKQALKIRTENDSIERLLPLCDSFAMAMSNTEAWEAIDKDWRAGVESINTQLQSILKSYKVTSIGAVNEPFDPELHEAMGEETVTDENAVDTIRQVLQTGYVRSDGDTTHLIRPARVIVGTN